MSSRAKVETDSKPVKKRLMFNISPANGGLVFAEPKRAKLMSRIRDAISYSSTWEEFRRAMPRKEYFRLIRELFDDADEPRPHGHDKFDGGQIPAYCDGDYPDWLQQAMADILPEEILEEFAEQGDTMLNGPYYHIDPRCLRVIKSRLKHLGYRVEDGTDLAFF
jgi:hypothetical protein